MVHDLSLVQRHLGRHARGEMSQSPHPTGNDKGDGMCHVLYTKLNFVEPSAVTAADGHPPHNRLPGCNVFDRTRVAQVCVHDAACHGCPQLEKHGFEFVTKGFDYPRVKQLLNEACGWEVLQRDLSAQPEYPGLMRHHAHSDGNKEIDLQPKGLRAVEENLANRGLGITRALVEALAEALSCRIIKLQSGWLFILYCVPVGIIRRAVYPKNGHPRHTGAGAGVHADQDISGDPLKAKGAILRWMLDSNWLRILNLWFPIGNMAARPLCVMDVQTLQPNDKVRHRWLDHDGWFFLHNPEQSWWWHSSLGQHVGDVIMFDALRTPHAAFPLPGEHFCHEIRDKLHSAFLESVACSGNDSRMPLLHDILKQIKSRPFPNDWPRPALQAISSVQTELEAIWHLSPTACKDKDKIDETISQSLRHLQRDSIEARVVAIGPFSFQKIFISIGLSCLVAIVAYFARKKNYDNQNVQ